jgi:DNA polymerase/3'-5' exonuclease PolX
MTETTNLVEYSAAKRVADRIIQLLQPHCELIHIAGSVRREKQLVKDIEIVCIPKRTQQPGLFDSGTWVVSSAFINNVKNITDVIMKGKFDGRYIQAVLKGGMKMDLFMPEPVDYYRQLAIRTGSADYSHTVLAMAWQKKGWCGSDKGLRLRSDCVATKTGWRCVRDGEIPPVWKSEEEFFSWLGVDCIHPRMRGL